MIISFLNSYPPTWLRKRYSTMHPLISLTDEIRHVLHPNKIACGIFFDLQEFFDIVDHSILLPKLAN